MFACIHIHLYLSSNLKLDLLIHIYHISILLDALHFCHILNMLLYMTLTLVSLSEFLYMVPFLFHYMLSNYVHKSLFRVVIIIIISTIASMPNITAPTSIFCFLFIKSTIPFTLSFVYFVYILSKKIIFVLIIA